MSDGIKELNCQAVKNVLGEYGITHDPYAIYSRTERRGRAEKSHNCGKRWLYASRQWIAEGIELKPVILLYTYSTVLYLHQWKVRCFWNCGLNNIQLLVTLCSEGRM